VPTTEQIGRTEVTRLLSDRYGLAVQIEDFVVPFSPTALNRPIQAVGLRQLTGASIIAIYRDSGQILVPRADTVLLPGDVLALLGEQDQLEAAIRFLTELASQKADEATPHPQVSTVAITASSPFVNHALAELGLREEIGVLIVGARRGPQQIVNPGPDFRVQPGDVLYLWGVPKNVEEARRRASVRVQDDNG
jgi:K+/H+ antiporter YhaU regulatory subunit KhtT